MKTFGDDVPIHDGTVLGNVDTETTDAHGRTPEKHDDERNHFSKQRQ